MMKLFATLIAAVAAVLAQPALAQSTTTGADANAANTVNVIAVAGQQNNPAETSVNYSGHTYTTPSVGGSYFGGTNPCLVGTGVGGAGGPIGFSLNLGKSDEGCTRRSDAAAWHAMGFDNIAVTRMCQDIKNADAFFATTGKACPGTGASGRYKLANGKNAPEAYLVASGAGTRTMPSDVDPQAQARVDPNPNAGQMVAPR